MDTSLNLAPAVGLTVPTPPAPARETSKVPPVTASNEAATLPADRPFVAQVVNAQLSDSDTSALGDELARPERTLRPFDVPMLPSDDDASATLGDNDASEIVQSRADDETKGSDV